MDKIFQDRQLDLFQTKKTVDWLVNNTTVNVFNPINFTGYQRQIDQKHCLKIVEFLRRDFFMPSAIICATDEELRDNDGELRIVDGQHRVNAFKMLREEDLNRYNEIKEYEIPVIVMSKVDQNTEIDTFITINKTSKKVDTSLALVLKNRINKYSTSNDLSMPKAEYISVELAQDLNYKEDPNNVWFDKILFEGNPKNTTQLISLNAFVKSTRVLLNCMAKKGLISLNWNDSEEIETCKKKGYMFITSIWSILQNKWPDLFDSEIEKRRILQGSIGYSSFNKVIVNMLQNHEYDGEDEFIKEFEERVKGISIESNKWLPGDYYSKYSSESGYGIVTMELLNAMGIN